MKRSLKNMAFIYQPKYKEREFWVACNLMQGKENYIIVTCSEHYNGIYKWVNDGDVDIVYNGKMRCYRVPIDKCTFYKSLRSVTNPDVIKMIRKQQDTWISGFVRNHERTYVRKPDWLI